MSADGVLGVNLVDEGFGGGAGVLAVAGVLGVVDVAGAFVFVVGGAGALTVVFGTTPPPSRPILAEPSFNVDAS
jgi:hypothetical protein